MIERSKSKILEVKKNNDKAVLSPQWLYACKKPIRTIKKDSANWSFETFLNNRIPPFAHLILPYKYRNKYISKNHKQTL